MKLNFRQGVVAYPQSGSLQDFLIINNVYVSLRASGIPVDVTFAHHQSDYLLTESVDIANAWGPIISGTDCYLYWDLDTRTGLRTFGYTTLEPVYGDEAPYLPTEGQHWFDTSSTTMKVAVGNGWREVIRVFAAVVNGITFFPLGYGFNSRPFAGSQVELTGLVANSGRIIRDERGQPIRRQDGTFLTTEDQIYVDRSPVNTIRLDATVSTGTAMENMAAYQVVKFDAFGELKLASYYDLQDKLIAMAMQDMIYGETGSVAFQGVIENPLWDWQNVGAPLWVSNAGLLTETDPHVANAVVFPEGKPPVARVMTRSSIYFEQGLGGIGRTGASGGNTGGLSIGFLNHGNPLGDADARAVDFNGPGISASRQGDTISVIVPEIPSAVTYYDHDTALGLPNVQQINFTGQVNASRAGNRVTIDVPATALQWQAEGNNLGSPNATTVNVAGNGISAARSGDTIIITSTDQRHNQLIDIQGGSVTERFHLTQSQVTSLSHITTTVNDLEADGGLASVNLVNRSPWKYPVRVATVEPLGAPFTGLITVDNVTLQDGDTVLVKNQQGSGASVLNGVWIAKPGVWQRSPVVLANGSVFYISEGASNATQAFVLSTTGTIVVNTTPIRFTSFNNAQFITLSGDAAGSGTTSIPVTLTNSGVTPGVYSQVQVDVKGRVIVGSNPTTLAGFGITDAVARSGSTMTGFLTLNANPSLPMHAVTKQYVDDATGGAGFTVNGGLSLVGTVLSVATASASRIVVNPNNLDLATVGTAGTYNSVTTDAYGRVVSGGVGNSLITLSGDIVGSGTSTITTTLPNIATAGTFRSVVVNTKGQVTSGSNPTTLAGFGITDAVARSGSTMTGALVMGISDTVSVSNNSITRLKDPVNAQDAATKHYVDTATGAIAYTSGNGINIAAGVISTNTSSRFAYSSGVLDLNLSGVTAGTYTSLTVDTYGRVTSATNPTPVNQPITLTGDVTGGGTASFSTTLSNSGVTAGSNYNKFNVDAKGRVTSASLQTTFAGLGLSDGIGSLRDVALTTPSASQVLSWNGTSWTNSAPIVGADRFAAVRSSDTVPGYLNTKLVFSSAFTTAIGSPSGDERLQIGLAATGTSTGGPFNTFTVGADGRILTANNTSGSNQNIVVTGDATGSGTTAITLTLANVATAGTYKSVTINNKGLVTGGTNPTTLAGYGLTDAQPLANTLTTLTDIGSGFVAKTSGGGTGSTRVVALEGTLGRITVANGTGNSGNTVFDLASGVITSPGIFTKVTVDTYGRVTTGGTITATDVGGLGTLAPMNSNAVTITGGSISGSSIAPRINNPVFATSLVLNWANADIIRITITDNVTITNAGGVAGQKYLLEITQGSVGGHTISFTSETVFGTDLTGITLSTGAGLTDEIGFIYNEVGTSYRCVALTRGFSS